MWVGTLLGEECLPYADSALPQLSAASGCGGAPLAPYPVVLARHCPRSLKAVGGSKTLPELA